MSEPGVKVVEIPDNSVSFTTVIGQIFTVGLVLIALALVALPVFLLWRWAL